MENIVKNIYFKINFKKLNKNQINFFNSLYDEIHRVGKKSETEIQRLQKINVDCQ